MQTAFFQHVAQYIAPKKIPAQKTCQMQHRWARYRAQSHVFALVLVFGWFLASCSSSVRFSSAVNSSDTRHSAPGTALRYGSSSDSKQRTTPIFERNTQSFEATDMTFRGQASYYGDEFHGRRTANGERYDREELSAAHRTLPFGTMVRVKNLQSDRTVVVRINDRGPFKESRIIDLSRAAADELDMVRQGSVPVEVTVLR